MTYGAFKLLADAANIICRTQKTAEITSEYQRVFNAICRAVLQVEPDQSWVDWNDNNQPKYCITGRGGGFCIEKLLISKSLVPPNSTREKAYEALAILEAEGIKPVGVEK